MKELSVEEKAKAYDNIIEKANKMHCENCEACQMCIEELIPELRESEDERIRKEIIQHIKTGIYHKDWIAYLEKQGEHTKFRDSIQIGDKVTRNEDGVLVNLSQLDRVAKPANTTMEEKAEMDSSFTEMILRDEQKPADKIEPKFKVGDWVIGDKDNTVHQIKAVIENVSNGKYAYDLIDGGYISTSHESDYHLWTIQDAKDGDVLATAAGAFIYNGNNGGGSCPGSYCGINTLGRFKTGVKDHWTGKPVFPSTKEQHDILFQKMNEAGYMWDAEKKELKKIDNEEVNGEDYGIDSLWHAQRILEKTLGSVDGYQSDDGILEHKCAISVVKKLYKQRPAEWSEEDENVINNACAILTRYGNIFGDIQRANEIYKTADGIKSLRPQKHWKPSEAQMKALKEACDEHWEPDGLDPLYTLYEQLKAL